MNARKEQELPEGTSRLLVDYEGAGALLSISSREVQRMVRRGELEIVKIGRLTRISVSSLEAWVRRESKPKWRIAARSETMVKLRRGEA